MICDLIDCEYLKRIFIFVLIIYYYKHQNYNARTIKKWIQDIKLYLYIFTFSQITRTKLFRNNNCLIFGFGE